jgi:hypothetical protein
VHADHAPPEDAIGSPPEDVMEDDEYNDTAVTFSFTSVAFTSSASSVADLSDYWVVDFACFVDLTALRFDFSGIQPTSRHSTVGGVGVFVMGSGTARIPVGLVYGHTMFRRVHALYTHDLSSRSAHEISRRLTVSWMQKHSECEF